MHKTSSNQPSSTLSTSPTLPHRIPELNLEECVWRQPYGTRFFVPIAWAIRPAKCLECLFVYVLHLAKHVIHACFALAYHTPVAVVGGPEVGLHLVIPQLVYDKRKDLPLVRFVFEVFRQDRAETAVVVVPLRVRAT